MHEKTSRRKQTTTISLERELHGWAKERGISISDAAARGIRRLQSIEAEGEDGSIDYWKEKTAKVAERLTAATIQIHDQERVIEQMSQRIGALEAAKLALK